jgi:hypothetical protein
VMACDLSIYRSEGLQVPMVVSAVSQYVSHCDCDTSKSDCDCDNLDVQQK